MRVNYGVIDVSTADKRAVMLTLPFPPTISSYYRSHKGRRLISREGRSFRRQAKGLAMQVLPTFKGRVSVSIGLYPPDRRRRDIDNYQKSLLDAITHCGLWLDDSQVDILRTERRSAGKPGCAVVHVEEMDDVE